MFTRAALYAGLLSGTLGACSANRNCLSGTLAPNYADRRDLRLLQREFRRATAAPPAVRARMYEALPGLFPDLSNRADAPRCAPELVQTLAAELERRPLTFDNATLHELDALGGVADTTDVMPEKARLLLSTAGLSDGAISSYRRLPEERGPTPTSAQLRARALAQLAHSNLFLNDARVRRFLLEKAIHSNDPREEGLLAFSVAELFQGSQQGEYARPLLAHWLERSQALCNAQAPNALEVLLSQLNYLGAYAKNYQLSDRARSLFGTILSADGRLPVTHGLDGAARDLVARTAQALDDDSDGPERKSWLEPTLPFPARNVRSRSDWAFDDSTNVEWPADITLRRVHELDQELTNARVEPQHSAERASEPQLQCWLFAQRAKWLPQSAQTAWLRSLLHDEKSPSCALTIAFDSETMPAAERAHVALTLLLEQDLERARFEAPNDRVLIARWALTNHPSWLNEEPRLNELLVAQALSEDADSIWQPKHSNPEVDEARRRFEFQAVIERSLGLLSMSPAAEARARAQALGRHWLELARAARAASAGFTDIYTMDLANALVLSLAELGPRLGLEQPVRELLTVPPEEDNGVLRVARLLFERARFEPDSARHALRRSAAAWR